MQPAGPAALAIADIAWAMFIGAALVLVGVMGLLLRAVWRGQSAVRPARWLMGAGLAFPIAVLVTLMLYSQWRSAALRADPPPDALVIGITARMWWWEVRYRNPVGGEDIVLANEIRVPAGRPVHLGLTSADVIHSVWFPALAGKMDTVPGRVNRLVFSVSSPGTHRGLCAEFCGEQHARMGMHLVAQAPEAFDAWLRAQALPAAAPATPLQARGREAFLAQRCNACHTVRGVSEEGRLAPDLTHVGSRLALGAATLDNNPQAMARWIAHVQQLKPGARMPASTELDAATLQALAAYLSHLQ
jgi:cytochrome c oxidase subunit II